MQFTRKFTAALLAALLGISGGTLPMFAQSAEEIEETETPSSEETIDTINGDEMTFDYYPDEDAIIISENGADEVLSETGQTITTDMDTTGTGTVEYVPAKESVIAEDESSPAGITEEGTQTQTTDEGTTTWTMDENGVQSIVKKDMDEKITGIWINSPDGMSDVVEVPMEAYPIDSDTAEGAIIMHVDAKSAVDLKVPVTGQTGSSVLGAWLSDGNYQVKVQPVIEDGYMYIPVDGSYQVFIFNNVKDFTDVPADASYYEAVHFVSSRGIMNGIGNDLFDPEGTVTRGMMARVIYNYYEMPAVTVTDAYGVDQGSYYYEAVPYVVDEGYMNPVSTDSFDGQEALSRESLAAILYKMAGSPAVESALSDEMKDGVADDAMDAVSWAYDKGFLTEDENGSLNPAGSLNRAELAAILERFITLDGTDQL